MAVFTEAEDAGGAVGVGTPELDDAGTGNPRRLGNLMRGMRLASAITAASSLSLSLSLSQ